MSEIEFAEEVKHLAEGMKTGDMLAALMTVVVETLHEQPTDVRYELARSMISLLHEHSTPGTA